MNKREATKLRRGDVVLWGLSVPYHYVIQVERSAAV
jgi:uncharacterized protein (UPF0248 family)